MTASQDFLRDQVANGSTAAANYERIRKLLSALRVSVTSPDRSVTVDVITGGHLADLRLTPQALHKTPEALASVILETVRAGAAKIAERTLAEVGPLTSGQIDVRAVAAGQLPPLGLRGGPAQEPEPVPALVSSAPADEVEDGFDGR